MRKYILLFFLLSKDVYAWVWDEFDSTSTDWTLTDQKRHELRQHAYCNNLCGFGHNEDADGYHIYRKHFFRTKESGTFREVSEFIMGSPNRGELTDKLDEMDTGDRSPKSMAAFVRVYCEEENVSFDDCLELEESVFTMENGETCLNVCSNQIIDTNYSPDFLELSPDRQEYERCLESYKGPGEFFDFNDKNSSTAENLLKSFQKYGFLFVKNFFSREFSEEINNVVNIWHDQEWKNLTFSDFYSAFEYQLSEYEFRKEFVLPYEEPFKTVLSSVHESVIMEVIRAYGEHRPVVLDFPASIMSYPGATQQHSHGDHGYEASMVKVGFSIHDIYEKNGPTSFCPCTHRKGIMNPAYNKPCGIRYHPDFIPAGTAILYDMSVKHRGSVNKGETRRYLLDLSYSAGYYSNRYYETYPEVAQEYVLMYRKNFKNL